jgi:hypothetical protein
MNYPGSNIVSLVSTGHEQFKLGMLGVRLISQPGVSDGEIMHRLRQIDKLPIPVSSQSEIDRVGSDKMFSFAGRYIQNRVQRADYRQMYELMKAGDFRRSTGYISLNQGIISIISLLLLFTKQAHDERFLPDLKDMLAWVKESYPEPSRQHPGLVNGNILLSHIISEYSSLTHDEAFKQYGDKVSNAAIYHKFKPQ